MKLQETKLNTSGVMRCCISSLLDYMRQAGDESVAQEGQHVHCLYEADAGMILDGDTWRAAWIVRRDHA